MKLRALLAAGVGALAAPIFGMLSGCNKTNASIPHEEELMARTASRKYLKTFAGETWQQALERFKNFCQSKVEIYASVETNKMVDAYVDEASTYTVVCNVSENFTYDELMAVENKETSEHLNQREDIHGVKIPPELRKLLQEHGSFKINWYRGRYKLEIFDASGFPDFQGIRPYSKVVRSLLGAEYIAAHAPKLSPEQMQKLDRNCFIFGCFYYTDEDYEYLYFTEKGTYGHFTFQCGDLPGNINKYLVPIMDGKAEVMTLDALVAWSVDKVILNMAIDECELESDDELY